jgi:hypothetical protein
MANRDPLAQLFGRPAAEPSAPTPPTPEPTEASAFCPEGRAPAKGRRKLWQLPHRFHCAVIGTCLEVAELRGMAPELDLGDFRDLSDYEVHTRFVAMAGARNPVSQRLQGMLDRRFARALRRYRGLRDGEGLQGQWRTDVAEGRVAGAFWALISHPATPPWIAYEVYGEIHMLGHQVGSGIRAGLRRLAELEQDHQQLEDRLREAEERANRHLLDKQKAMEERDQWRERATAAENRQHTLERELARWEADRDHRRLCQRLRYLESQLAHQTRRAERAEQRACAPADASTGPAYGTRAADPPAETAKEPACPDLRGNCVLCVGGRKQVRDHYRRVVEAANGRFLHHDGGIEQGSNHLAQMLERADQVVCPVDCVGHQAVRCVKDHCRRKGTPCRFLNSASVTALSRALPQLPVARPAAERQPPP